MHLAVAVQRLVTPGASQLESLIRGTATAQLVLGTWWLHAHQTAAARRWVLQFECMGWHGCAGPEGFGGAGHSSSSSSCIGSGSNKVQHACMQQVSTKQAHGRRPVLPLGGGSASAANKPCSLIYVLLQRCQDLEGTSRELHNSPTTSRYYRGPRPQVARQTPPHRSRLPGVLRARGWLELSSSSCCVLAAADAPPP